MFVSKALSISELWHDQQQVPAKQQQPHEHDELLAHKQALPDQHDRNDHEHLQPG